MQTEQSNTRNAMAAVYKEFGVVGFFRGISSPLASSSLLTAATFSAYNVFKRGLGLKEHDEYDCRVFIAGAILRDKNSVIYICIYGLIIMISGHSITSMLIRIRIRRSEKRIPGRTA
jgi:hypothetical protein